MIKRINLIEKQKFSLTYKNLAQIYLGVFAVIALVIGVQHLRVYRMKPLINQTKIELENLREQNKVLTSRPVKKKVSVGELQDLLDELESVPNWSKLMRMVTYNLPNSVWVASIKSVGGLTPSAEQEKVRKKGKKDKKTELISVPKSDFRMIEISGRGMEVGSITEFLTNLEKLPQFRNLVLSNSKIDQEGYSFTMHGEILVEYAK